MRHFVEAPFNMDADEFDLQHEEWCRKILENVPVTVDNFTFGQAAKIIAVYLKTTFLLPEGVHTPLADVIHPLPIDSRILEGVATKFDLPRLKTVRWTKMSSGEYKTIKQDIREKHLPFNWRLEDYWKPEKTYKANE